MNDAEAATLPVDRAMRLREDLARGVRHSDRLSLPPEDGSDGHVPQGKIDQHWK